MSPHGSPRVFRVNLGKKGWINRLYFVMVGRVRQMPYPISMHHHPFLLLLPFLAVSCRSQRLSSADYHGPPAFLQNGVAMAPPSAPGIVHQAVALGNSLQQVTYQYGGGHGRPSSGVDCSGMVSHVLRNCGLMTGAAVSKEFRNYGAGGPGQWITIYAKKGHTFMTIAGLRLDTGNRETEGGPRWTSQPRQVGDFKARHPAGL